MSIATWIGTLNTNIAAVTGMGQVHDYRDLPGSIQVFPTALIMPVSGTQTGGKSAPGIAIHEVQVTLYVAAQVMPEALTLAVPFIALVRDKIYSDVTLGGTCYHCLPRADGNFYDGPGGLVYGDKTLCGIMFHLSVKEIETFTTA